MKVEINPATFAPANYYFEGGYVYMGETVKVVQSPKRKLKQTDLQQLILY